MHAKEHIECLKLAKSSYLDCGACRKTVEPTVPWLALLPLGTAVVGVRTLARYPPPNGSGAVSPRSRAFATLCRCQAVWRQRLWAEPDMRIVSAGVPDYLTAVPKVIHALQDTFSQQLDCREGHRDERDVLRMIVAAGTLLSSHGRQRLGSSSRRLHGHGVHSVNGE
eukprot:6064300-Pleurochrysis_carterae.AAC.5